MTPVKVEDQLVHSSVLQWAKRDPERIAVYTEETSISFGDLTDRAIRLAAAIEKRRARRVGLCLPNDVSVIELFFSSLIGGACVCVFDPSWPTQVLRELVCRHAPNLFFSASETLEEVSDLLDRPACVSVDQLLTWADYRDEQPALKSQPTPDMPFLIGFTSGSSGIPKAFIRSHQTWAESFRLSAQELGTNSADVVIAPGPLSHGLSLYAAIEAISAGGAVAVQKHFDATKVLDDIQRLKGTVLVVVPTMLDVLMERTGVRKFDSVERIVTAGAKLSPALRARTEKVFPNAETIEYYGASELSFITVARGSDSCPPDSVGRPFAGVDVEVRDEDGSRVSAGETGVIWVRSAMLSSGYVGPTDGSGFRADGSWATVGDLGHMDEQGYLYLDGREGSVITSAGYTVYPSAIEAALLVHPSVADAAVIGVPDPRWGEIIGAAIVFKKGLSCSEQDLVDHCHACLEPYACPRRWRFIDTLESTPSGKTKRASLRSLFE